jgi:TRAP transporter 4TM/12TM fusion protein
MTETIDTTADDDNVPESTAVPGLGTPLEKVIFVLALVFGLLGIYYLIDRPVPQVQYTNLHIMLALVLFFLIDLYRRDPISDWDLVEKLTTATFGLAIVAGFLGTVYFQLFYEVLAYERIGRYPFQDVIAGAMILVGVIYATKRAYGKLITSVVILTLLFARFGAYLPGLLNHRGLGWERIITMTTVELNGVYHLITQIGATWILVFLLWAGIVEEMGGLETFFDIGFLIGNRFKSGIAQTAVVSSMIMGSISGSPMANAAVTGSFTIPLMKDRGLDGKDAGAIEAVASTGGMILPPIMGSVAFLMANFLGRSYGEIIIIAAIPAILFYAAVALSVHLIVIRSGVEVSVEREVDRRQIAIDFSPILASLVVLVYLLVGLGYPPGTAGVFTIGALLSTDLVKRLLVRREVVPVVRRWIVEGAKGLRTGAVRMVPITIVLAAMGIIISSFSITGTGYRLSLSIVDISGGNIPILLGLVMISSIILGMGMPTVAAYLLTITLVAPAMVQVGFERLTAHFFVFYFAMLAAITPPIALAPAVTSQIAEAEFTDTAIRGIIIGIPLFLLPYIFAFNESLLLFDGMTTVMTFALALGGIVLITAGLHASFSFVSGWRRNVAKGASVLSGLTLVFLPVLVSLV